MKKNLLIVISIIVILTISILAIIHNKSNLKGLKVLKLIKMEDINNIIINIPDETIEKENDSKEIETTINEVVKVEKSKKSDKVKNNTVEEKNNSIKNQNIEETQNIKPEEKKGEQEPSIIDNSNTKVNNKQEQNNITETTQSKTIESKKEEVKENNSSNVETVTTDSSGNLMNKETCYKESVDIQFRKSGISSTGCFSTGQFKDNGEEIYYLDLRYE